MKNYNLEPVSDSFQAYLVSGAYFSKSEEYPLIPSDFISQKVPKSIMPFNKAINYHGDLSDTFICFYEPDETFERIRRTPRKYVSFFQKTAGIIGLDFSIHSDMPLVKQKSQINDNLSLTYFYGSQGIPVLPNLRCGSDELLPEFLSVIPSNSIVAIGTHGFIKTQPEKYEWYCFLEKVIDKVHPQIIVVYGTLRDPMFDNLKERARFVFYDSWLREHRQGVSLHVD